MSVAERLSFKKGDIIDNRFSIVSHLGEGTFGTVYCVSDRSGNKYALKLLRLWEVHPEIRKKLILRFHMEYETGCIESDHLVRSFYHGFYRGNPYIVMEFCEGGDLVNALQRNPIDFTKVAVDVLSGLKALHQNGKVHRDLKPENVLLKSDGNYALTDFGIAGDRNKRMTEKNILGKPKQIFGTYAYMPPEQVSPKKEATVLPTTDIFSFGVMMFQLITGELPYGKLEDERDLMPYLRRGKNGQWDRQKLLSTKEGKQWESVIEGCLRPQFQYRFQTTDEVRKYIPNISQYGEATNSSAYQTEVINGLCLHEMQGEEYGTVYYLGDLLKQNKRIVKMGRRDEGVTNEISIKEENSCYISRYHCTLEYDDLKDKWIIRDGQWQKGTMGGWVRSTNGTYVNSSEVSVDGMYFKPGDIISVGDTKFRVEGY